MKYGYCRVSTRGQAREGNSLEYQEQKLRDAGASIIQINMCCSFVAIKLIE